MVMKNRTKNEKVKKKGKTEVKPKGKALREKKRAPKRGSKTPSRKNAEFLDLKRELESVKSQNIELQSIVESLRCEINEEHQKEKKRTRIDDRLKQLQEMEAVGTLAGGVAHDLNNVLSGLISYPELILMDLPLDSPIRKQVLAIQRSGEKAAAMVQDLLTLARRGVVVTEVLNLNYIIREYLASPEFEKLKCYHSNIHVAYNPGTDLLNILGSPVHVSKAVMNLVSNAAEAMPDGGNINVTTDNYCLKRTVTKYEKIKAGEYVTLTVSDSGIGISKEDLEKIFEPFFTKKEMGRSGTGLGMAVVWATIKDHNGYIDVKSSMGKGTQFTLYFPITKQSVKETRDKFLIEKYKGHGEKILVVDDEDAQRDIATIILKKLGYTAITAASGEEAVDYLSENSVELILLDMIMNRGIDGLDTYKQVIKFHPGQKTIITSGFSETDRVKEMQKLGAGEYIKKPYNLEKISKAIYRALVM